MCYYLPTPGPPPSVVLSYTFRNMLLRVMHPLSRSVRYLTKLHYHASSRSTKRGSHFPILTNSSHAASSEGAKQRYKLNVWAHVNIWCTCAHKYLPRIGMRAEVGEPSKPVCLSLSVGLPARLPASLSVYETANDEHAVKF